MPDKIRSSEHAMQEEEAFVPRGAVAFFVAMIVFYTAFWFLLFALMVGRS